MEFVALILLHLLSFLHILHFWGFRFYHHFFFPSVQKFISEMNIVTAGTKAAIDECPQLPEELTDEEEFCIDEEINIVMQRLGIKVSEETENDDVDQNLNVNMDVSEFRDIFVDEEPSLSEIEQVFGVFDANGDGFIDATELQRVLGGLSMREGSELERCERMICAFDANGDGLLDFDEFVVVMEKCFC